METLYVPTPSEIIAFLDLYVISQDDAKETLAIAISNHFAMQGGDHYTPEGATVDKFSKPNYLVIGPTGSGKTLMLESLSRADTLGVPFAIIDTSKCTESGYVGDKVENALITLWIKSGYDLEKAQRGIIYFDEIDKISKKAEGSTTRDVSGEGVQRGLLSIFGGITIRLSTKGTGTPKPEIEYIDFDTSKVQFACGGAFPELERIIEKRLLGTTSIGFKANVVSREENDKKAYEYLLQVEDEDLIEFGLIPELVGRLPYRSAVQPLSVADLSRILIDTRNCLADQHKALMRKKNIIVTFTEGAVNAIAEEAYKTKTGARSLQRILQQVLKATELLSPAEKEISEDDVVNRRRKLIEARRLLREKRAAEVKTEPTVANADEAPPVVTVRLDAGKEQKELVCLNLPVPSAMWEVYRDGEENRHTRLMQTADNRRFHVIRRVFYGTHRGGCQHQTNDMICEWIVPYHKGAHPVELIGRHVPVNWVCGGCRQPVVGNTLDLGEPRWKDGRVADSVLPSQPAEKKSA